MNEPIPEDQNEAVKAALFAGRKIEAVKLHRERTGMGLKESKDAMDKLEAELRASSPERFSKPPAMGCAGMFVMLVLAGAGGIAWHFVWPG